MTNLNTAFLQMTHARIPAMETKDSCMAWSIVLTMGLVKKKH